MIIRYYKKDDTVGHRTGACFEIEQDSKETSTGRSYTVYWLTDEKGNRAPESVYRELEKGKIEMVW